MAVPVQPDAIPHMHVDPIIWAAAVALIMLLIGIVGWYISNDRSEQAEHNKRLREESQKAISSLTEKVEDLQKEVHLIKVAAAADRQAWADLRTTLADMKREWRDDMQALRSFISVSLGQLRKEGRKPQDRAQ